MSDTPNRPPEPAPEKLGNSATGIFTIPSDTSCPACTLPVRQGQSAVITDLGHVLHSYCWDRQG